MLFLVSFVFITAIFFLFAWNKLYFSLPFVLLVALIVRIILTFLFATSFSSDEYSFITTGHVLLSHVNAYPSMYFPFIFYFGALTILIGKYIAPLLFLKLVFVFFDVGVTYFIAKLAKNTYPALLYAVNPIMLIILTVHGQMDSMPLFFLLWSILALQKKKDGLSGFLLAIGVAIKPWPLIFLPLFLKKSKRPYLYFWVGLLPAITVLLHSYITHVSILNILTPIKNYRGIYTVWGIGSVMYTLFPTFWNEWIQLFRRIFLAGFGIWSFLDHKRDLVGDFFWTMLTFFVFSPLFGSQWISWIVPFLLLVRPQLWKWSYFLLTIYIAIAFFTDSVEFTKWSFDERQTVINSIGLVAWLSLIFVYFRNRKQLSHSKEVNIASNVTEAV